MLDYRRYFDLLLISFAISMTAVCGQGMFYNMHNQAMNFKTFEAIKMAEVHAHRHGI